MRPFAAFDTATDHLALALGDLDTPGAVLAALDFPAPRAANTVVLPTLERLLRSASLDVKELAAVAVGRGPGSFTGVRIGVATAKGLAHGLGVPLVGLSTLDAVAWRSGAAGLLGVVGDAMRGEVYPALYRAGRDGVERLSADRVARPADVAGQWAELGEPITITGNGLAKHRGVFEEMPGLETAVAEVRLWAPAGESLVAAAWSATGPATLRAIAGLERGEAYLAAHPQAMLPVYTRLADAEEAERLRLGRPDILPAHGVAGPAGGETR